MRTILRVNKENIHYLLRFIDNAKDSLLTFKYFNTRKPDVIKNHYVTLLIIENDEPVGYGHLDNDNNVTWLGIALIPSFKHTGLGKFIMGKLIDEAKKLHIKEIFLTVVKDNSSAIIFFEKFKFFRVKEEPTFFLYKRTL